MKPLDPKGAYHDRAHQELLFQDRDHDHPARQPAHRWHPGHDLRRQCRCSHARPGGPRVREGLGLRPDLRQPFRPEVAILQAIKKGPFGALLFV